MSLPIECVAKTPQDRLYGNVEHINYFIVCQEAQQAMKPSFHQVLVCILYTCFLNSESHARTVAGFLKNLLRKTIPWNTAS